jgi:hypothetical protein
VGAPEPLRLPVSWRRALTPVFVSQRYPGGYWRVLDALCDLQKGRHHQVFGGADFIVEHAGLSRRYVERILIALRESGVLQLVEQSTGGRKPADQNGKSKGLANTYELGPLVFQLPPVEPRSTGRGSTSVYRPGFRGAEPRSTGRGSHPAEPRSTDRSNHALSADVRVFRHVSGEVGGDGGGRSTTALSSDPPQASPSCRYCNTVDGHQDWCSRPMNNGRLR